MEIQVIIKSYEMSKKEVIRYDDVFTAKKQVAWKRRDG